MNGVKLKYPQRLALFRTLFDDEVGNLIGSGHEDPVLLLALHRMEFLQSYEKLLLVKKIDSKEALLSLGAGDAEAIIMRKIGAGRWKPGFYWEKALCDRDFIAGRNIAFIPISDSRFPPQLREIYRPPFGIFVRGKLPDPEHPAVALVGTRVPSGRGIRAAYALAAELSEHGICVVSGLARGIDASAHRGALKGAGKTMAVLPGGIESVYPSSNKMLAASILERGGALLTEYPPFCEIHRYKFPERNRIIAGLSRSCVIIEAPEGSGALITADHALTEGRDVYVHGACIGSSRNAGADALASQGAGIVNNADDIFSDWAMNDEVREKSGAGPAYGARTGGDPRGRRRWRLRMHSPSMT